MTNSIDAIAGLQSAIAKAGGKAKLAEAAGINRSTLSNWLKRGRGVPARGIHLVANATGMAPHEIRPDLYPAPGFAGGTGVRNAVAVALVRRMRAVLREAP